MSKIVKVSGKRPKPQNGLKAFNEKHGDYAPYAVAPVAESLDYLTKAKKAGVTHIDDQGIKHAWTLESLSYAAEQGKCKFINEMGEPAGVDEDFKHIELNDRVGRNELGEMLT